MDTGTLWLNLGDTYAKKDAEGTGVKPGELIGVPWRMALALQADGWYLRSDIIWDKPNPKPESVKNRPTKAHEYLFLFSKQERYYYDIDAPAGTRDIDRRCELRKTTACDGRHRRAESPAGDGLATESSVGKKQAIGLEGAGPFVPRRPLRGVPAEIDQAVHPRRVSQG